MKAKEILHMLDEYTEDFNFPVLDNYNFDLAQCRLTVFRDKERWLIVFEMVVVDEKQDISNDVYIYSNITKQNGLIIGMDDIVSLVDNKWWYDDKGIFVVDPFCFTVFIKGEEVASTLKTDEYVQLGIKTEPFSLAGLLRYLSFKYGEKLWATNQELFNEIGGNIELSLFFQTEEWEHPDISDDQKPSEVVFFRSLAQAIERNNVDLIQLNTSNTHWSNWTGSDFEN